MGVGDGPMTRVSTHWCPVEPSGLHKWGEDARVVYTLHPRCAACGYINVEVDLEAIREEERRAKAL